MIDPVTGTYRPKLARRAMLRRDEVRGVDMILLPERVIKLNPTAAAVLHLCNGSRTVGDIVLALQVTYTGSDLEADVEELLSRLTDQGVFAQ